MTPKNTTLGEPTNGSNSTDHFQKQNKSTENSVTSASPPLDPGSAPSFTEQRNAYFKTHYDVMTGVRIAGILGGFFIFVLLTLLYKSKCKKNSGILTPTLKLNNPNIMGGQEDNLASGSLDPPTILVEMEGGSIGNFSYPMQMTPMLVLTSELGSSESSIESDVSFSGLQGQDSSSNFSQRSLAYQSILPPPVPKVTRPRKSKRKKCKTKNQLIKGKQNIDIHVIQPTPTISPSGSELFPKMKRKKQRDTAAYFTSHRASDSEVLLETRRKPLILLQAEDLNLKFADDTSSENIPTRASDSDQEDEQGSMNSVFTFQDDTKDNEIFDEGESEGCKLILKQTHVQVHHRDSYCSSELESITDYLESHRRRSSSTQTTISDLRQSLLLNIPSSRRNSSTSPSSSALLTPAIPANPMSLARLTESGCYLSPPPHPEIVQNIIPTPVTSTLFSLSVCPTNVIVATHKMPYENLQIENKSFPPDQ